MVERISDLCPKCGAGAGACGYDFNELPALEYLNPHIGAVHHIIVVTHMLQHSSKLTKQAWGMERDLLRNFLIDPAAPQELRRRSNPQLDGGTRAFKIKSATGKPLHARSRWTRTILDVRPSDAVDYREDIRAWASATLANCAGLQPG